MDYTLNVLGQGVEALQRAPEIEAAAENTRAAVVLSAQVIDDKSSVVKDATSQALTTSAEAFCKAAATTNGAMSEAVSTIAIATHEAASDMWKTVRSVRSFWSGCRALIDSAKFFNAATGKSITALRKATQITSVAMQEAIKTSSKAMDSALHQITPAMTDAVTTTTNEVGDAVATLAKAATGDQEVADQITLTAAKTGMVANDAINATSTTLRTAISTTASLANASIEQTAAVLDTGISSLHVSIPTHLAEASIEVLEGVNEGATRASCVMAATGLGAALALSKVDSNILVPAAIGTIGLAAVYKEQQEARPVQEQYNGTVGTKKKCTADGKDVAVTFINGICNTLESVRESAKYISRSHGDAVVHYVADPTQGAASDLAQAAVLDTIGVSTEASRRLAITWKRLLQEGNEKIVHYGHSRGGMVTAQALKELSLEEQEKLEIHTIGSPVEIFTEDGGPKVVHHFSTADAVPFATVSSLTSPPRKMMNLALGKENPTIQRYDTQAEGVHSVVSDHSLLGPTYKRVLDQCGQNFQQATKEKVERSSSSSSSSSSSGTSWKKPILRNHRVVPKLSELSLR